MFNNFQQKVQKILSGHFYNDNQFDLDHMTWKTIRTIYPLEAFFVLSLATFKRRGQKILSEHDLDPSIK